MSVQAYLGVDLGSTTSKAVLVDGEGALLGRGITNTRSNYDVAVDVVRGEALMDARLTLIGRSLGAADHIEPLRRALGVEIALHRLRSLERRTLELAASDAVEELFAQMEADADSVFGALAADRSRFFRDAAVARFFTLADVAAHAHKLEFDEVAGAFDRALVEVENRESLPVFEVLLEQALRRARRAGLRLDDREIARAHSSVSVAAVVGTGYGRQRLPFPKEQLQSEILCHGLGAHALFPATRTVLDIGGQDTKAIQVDGDGLVTSFQMNDRCAAGCGRYLGYIADELNLGVHELGPMAMRGTRAVKISSTCTVFAGVELREFLATGERRENVLLGLHRAIVLRAMSLLARSGGVADELTFTGGVAKNEAVVHWLQAMVREHYGQRRINIHTDSIYMGALGAALFARRGAQAEAAA